MKIIKLTEGVYKIQEFLSSESLDYFQSFFGEKNFLDKSSMDIFSYSISILSNNSKNDFFLKEFYQFEAVLCKLYNTKMILNPDLLLVKMVKDSFLSYHTDEYSFCQCVLHLSSWKKQDGGELLINGINIEPEYNSVIFFSGMMKHAVTTITSLYEQRKSISFGYNKLSEKDSRYSLYIQERKRYLGF